MEGGIRLARLGQFWDRTSCNDGTYKIFISPELDRPLEILCTLAHEIIHTIVGCDKGHKGEFVTLCEKIGLVKPWTATTPGPDLAATLAICALQLGSYLHALYRIARWGMLCAKR